MKTILVTGSARRIGAEIVKHCHQQGSNVIIHANHSLEEANKLAEALNQQRENSAIVLQADCNDLNACHELISQAAKQWGRLDALINNASIFFPTDWPNAQSSEWDALMNANVRAPYFLSQAAFPHLKQTKGCIVNITDVHASKPLKNHTLYCMSKAALVMMTESLAKECAPDVRVNAVAPGNILWPEGKKNDLSDADKAAILKQNVLHRQGTPTDIAKACWFLIHDADYTTGETIAVDGGRGL